jgi:hypothetical protein
MHFRLERNPSRQVRTPALDVAFREPERHMSWAMGAVWRDRWPTRLSGRLGRGLRVEEEEHTLTAAEEDVPPRLPAEHVEADDVPVEPLRLVQIRTVQSGLQYPGGLQLRRRHPVTSLARA